MLRAPKAAAEIENTRVIEDWRMVDNGIPTSGSSQ
jgi:hypothetical protein